MQIKLLKLVLGDNQTSILKSMDKMILQEVWLMEWMESGNHFIEGDFVVYGISIEKECSINISYWTILGGCYERKKRDKIYILFEPGSLYCIFSNDG